MVFFGIAMSATFVAGGLYVLNLPFFVLCLLNSCYRERFQQMFYHSVQQEWRGSTPPGFTPSS